MSQKKSSVGLIILGIALLWGMAGCSSQMETTILSEKAPPEPEVAKVEEEPASPAEPVVSETTVGEQDLGIPPREAPQGLGTPPSEIQVEEPSKPIIPPSSPEMAAAIPPAKAGEAKAIEPSPAIGPVIGGIPPMVFDPEMPPQPTMRRGGPEEVAMLEPEPIKVPEKERVVPPVQGEPTQREPGLAPFMVDPDLPPDPTLREGQPEEIETPVKEKRLEVVKVQPGAPRMPIKTLADVYFDYDRYSLRDDDKNKLNDNAQILVDQFSGQKVVIEGHCDERGTESYNMILGKRRAETVKKFLVDLGVPEENLEVVSYGKERPFCTDHSLECWQENRRGHFVVR
ncbi:MAG: OmpA family protein [Nitrospirota bacterium]|nr:MAG: OmpA family protein [Nitrospirota bacterium]